MKVRILISIVFCLLFCSCRNDMDKISFFDRKDLPQQSLDSVRAIRSQNGKRQMILTSPKVVVYDKPKKKTEYPQGFNMQIYEGEKKMVALISAKYAISLDEEKIIKARDSVVVIDYRTGDTSYLETITWNSAQHRIYSDNPVKSVNGKRVTYGDGFESDDEFTMPYINGQRGTMTIEE